MVQGDVMIASELAHYLRISLASAYTLMARPDFPTIRVGNRKLVRGLFKNKIYT